jgi:hypothetical protein
MIEINYGYDFVACDLMALWLLVEEEFKNVPEDNTNVA